MPKITAGSTLVLEWALSVARASRFGTTRVSCWHAPRSVSSRQTAWLAPVGSGTKSYPRDGHCNAETLRKVSARGQLFFERADLKLRGKFNSYTTQRLIKAGFAWPRL
ncbi:hypothetical protein MATL_G00056320 [Megalops atlanticus]|uniref:Uncharacterized protein n=1 Tax=Megalops atlanticus TaxID=7932 RepID=A0A9D3Q628_MEGAT|nr:hypothetical protein MATL_G00056320 [Megalops atlanticus]